ncbi:hypothetical protein HPB51_003995 [Rhipicephalus microplus]|uniref:SWIM-type domain-containing protein n=1 Tax=Rhipicephalus microplus TaxID=6941 RepID=A0A9J6DT17_RHIMP|nr:hypothetical protein HPB51_003995 [Rhipicephalus microplus]
MLRRSLRRTASYRYEKKVRLCGVDPFTLQAADYIVNVNLWPCVDAAYIREFLMLRMGFVTQPQLKSRKALDGHNFVTSGWLREPRVKQVAAESVTVMTQALNKPPVEVWILGKAYREILAAHCTCMVENREACSHIAALFFYVKCGVRAHEERSFTGGPNSWLPPAVRKLNVRPTAKMNLPSSAMKKRRIDTATSETCAR